MNKFLKTFLAFLLIITFIPNGIMAQDLDNATKEKVDKSEETEEIDEEFLQLKEKYQLLKDENGRLRIELRNLHGKVNKGNATHIPVLMYHHILEQSDIEKHKWENNVSVLSVETFEKQMKYLYDNDFYVASLDELEMYLDNKLDLPKKTVVLTFDDGYLSNAKYAYPIMQKYNFRATMFMIGYRVDAPQADFDPSDTQSLSIVESTKYTDVFDYHSHTYQMHDFKANTREPLLLSSSEEDIKKDLLKNKTLTNAKYIAYPYGRYNDKVVRLTKETGYRLGFTINKGFVVKNSNKFRLPRNGISPNVNMTQFKNLVNTKQIIK